MIQLLRVNQPRALQTDQSTERIGNVRVMWCPGPELNRYVPFGTRDFKSRASASFATRAGGHNINYINILMHSRCHRSCTFRLLGGSCGGTKLFKRGAKSIFVRVRISCDHSNALPTKFLHCFQIYTSSNQSCCPGMTQAMPCKVLIPASRNASVNHRGLA
jgi:hypothetical protein